MLMDKQAAAEINDLFVKGASALRQVVAERDHWKKEAQSYERRERAEKVAHAMHDKGINGDVPFEHLVAQMEKAAEEGGLDLVEKAVDLVGPDMGAKIGHLSQGSGGDVPAGDSSLVRFIQGAIG